VKFFRNNDYKKIKPFNTLKEVLKEKTNLNEQEIENFWSSDEDQNIIIFNGKTKPEGLLKNEIIETIEKIHFNGPLCGEKLTEIKISIEQLIVEDSSKEESFTSLTIILYEALKKGLIEAELILLEPIYHTIIQLPPDHIKNTLSLLSKYSAKIKSMDQEKEYQAIIEILLSVRNSINFAKDIRNSSSGRAFWQNEFYRFMEVPHQESARLIQDIKFHKGVSW
jgi:elongation factor 2